MKVTLVLCAAVLAASCKASRRSSEKSLDTLTGQQNEEVCSGTVTPQFTERYEIFWNHKGIVAPDGYKFHLSGILASVPLELQSWFFLKGGKLQLISNASQVCDGLSGTPLFSPNGDVGGCIAYDKLGDEIGMPTIYISVVSTTYEAQQKEASLAVQGFAAVLSSFLTEVGGGQKLEGDKTLRYTLGGFDADMRNIKTGLGFMVVDDLVRMRHPDGKSYADKLPQKFRDLVKASGAFDTRQDRDTRWKAFWGAYDDVPSRDFTNFMVAQVFESKWCNDSTRKAFAGKAAFDDTGRYFDAEVAPLFNEAFTEAQSEISLAGTDDVVPEPVQAPMAAAPSVDNQAMALGGRRLPVLAGILWAPFAVGNYFADDKPVRGFFQTHQPVRRVLLGAVTVGTMAARAVVQGAGGVIGAGYQVISGRGYYGGEFFSGGGSGRQSSTYYRNGTYVGSGLTLNRLGYRLDHGCLLRRWRC